MLHDVRSLALVVAGKDQQVALASRIRAAGLGDQRAGFRLCLNSARIPDITP